VVYAVKVNLVYRCPPGEPAKLRAERALRGVAGIKQFLVMESKKMVTVFYDPGVIKREKIRDLLLGAGFTAVHFS